MPKIKQTKKVIKAWIIKNKTCETPWTMELYPTSESAWRGFDIKNGLFNFSKKLFEVIPVTITYTLANKTTK